MPDAGSQPKARVFDKTVVTLFAIGLVAIGLSNLVVNLTPDKLPLLTMQKAGPAADTAKAATVVSQPGVVWATTAPGRVEPRGGSVRMRPEASGRIVEVLANAGDDVRRGDPLALLRDDAVMARLVQARAEVAVRLGERDEEDDDPEAEKPSQLVLDRRKAADDLAGAERARFAAWRAFDTVYMAHRAGKASADDVEAARGAIETAKQAVAPKAAALREIQANKDMPLPTRLDSGLTLAREDLRLAEIAFDNTRVRAPIDGTVLRFDARVGEMAAPGQRLPIGVFGDMSAIQVTAEVQERDVSKVRVGQSVIVRSNAFADLELTGKVTEVAPSVGSPGLRAQGPRQQIDAEVLEVKIELDGKPPVMPGMRVDVFFKAEQRVSAARQ